MRNFILCTSYLVISLKCLATGGVSTYFNIFVPPNNDPVQNNVCLVVTAVHDSTFFNIEDRAEDGDSDDSVSGMLMAGQSYILYIRDNGVNDDSHNSGAGIQAHDGDHFIITSDKGVIAYQATDNDWQHDWVPSVSNQTLGEKFIIYCSGSASTNKDVNLFAFTDSTTITIRKISNVLTQTTGYTNVDMYSNNIVLSRNLNVGEDLIYQSTDGHGILEEGGTYVIESNQPISVQYGALEQRERDGGGYVTSSNGSSTGELFYFTVPYQASKEQEIRIVSWDDTNNVLLERYYNGMWISMNSWTLNDMETAEWVGEDYNATYDNVFRATCSSNKRVSILECNWLETSNGSAGSYDMATMLSSEDGTTTGTKFLAYMAPPGKQTNVVDPFTSSVFGERITHLYIFAKDSSTVTVKDTYTNGTDFFETYTIGNDGYVDCNLTQNEWESIYNGNGNPNSGPERPYLIVQSTNPVAVMNTNFCDDWMMYFGSSEQASFSLQNATSNASQSGDTVTIVNKINFVSSNFLENPEVDIIIKSGAIPVEGTLKNITDNTTETGTIAANNHYSRITLESSVNLDPNKEYEITTRYIPNDEYNDGTPMEDTVLLSTEVSLRTTNSNGSTKQSTQTEVTKIFVEDFTLESPTPLFEEVVTETITEVNNAWTGTWVDYDGDNDQDLILPLYGTNNGSIIYRNDGGTFTKITSGVLYESNVSGLAITCADIDNDGDRDCFICSNAGASNQLLMNDGSGVFSENSLDPSASSNGYHHGACFADYDNDGYVDIFLSDFMPTKYNELYRNVEGSFELVENNDVANSLGRSIGSTWADCDNDGDQDLFVPNGNLDDNLFFRNDGSGELVKETNTVITTDAANCVASCWGDYDNDGDLDLFVSNAGNAANFLYNNDGSGTFTRITEGPAVTDVGNSHGCSWVDYDNDGDLDLYVSNDQKLYDNDGNGNFTSNTLEIITQTNDGAYGHSWADYDNDGDLDLFVATHSSNESKFYKNLGNDNHWFECKLVGTNSNKSAIGARVKIKSNGSWQIREVNSQSGFGGQNSLIQHFGLGSQTSIDSLIIQWPSGYVQTMTSINADQLLSIQEDDAALISGYAFNDVNGNCSLDIGEEGIANCEVILTPGGLKTWTNSQGYYSMRVPIGVYSITQNTPTYWDESSCFTNISNLLITSVNDILPNNNISMEPQLVGVDLSIDASHTALRKGFQNQMIVSYNNEGTESYEDTINVAVTFPTEVIPLTADPAWDYQLGTTYYWTVFGLSLSEQSTIHITDSSSIASIVGDSLNFTASISEFSSELDNSDNTVTFNEEVKGAIDPNDLLVTPIGEGSQHFINQSQRLKFRIRFQNVGNYPAQFVNISNLIDEYLDMNTLRIEATSHEASFEVNKRELSWFFADINLPDSSTNEALSHGFVEYSILPDEASFNGYVINNQASIIFDYEAAIVTNRTFHTVLSTAENSNISVIPIPNPSTGDLFLHFTENLEVNAVDVYGLNGKLIEKGSFEKGKLGVHLKLKKQLLGMYIIRVYFIDGTTRNVRVFYKM